MKRMLSSTLKVTLILFLSYCFSGCKKNFDSNLSNPNVQKILNWIDTNAGNEVKMEAAVKLKQTLNFSLMYEEKSGENENLLIVPFTENYKKDKKIQPNVTVSLVLIVNRLGNIRKANIIEFTAKSGQSYTNIPQMAIYNMYNTAENVNDGVYRICGINGKRQFELTYQNGVMRKLGKVTAIDKNGNLIPATKVDSQVNGIKNNYIFECSDVYMVTTYYNEAGNYMYSEREFLFRQGNCNTQGTPQDFQPDLGGSGNQIPEEEEFYRGVSFDWTVINNTYNSYFVGVTTKLRGRNGSFTACNTQGVYCSGCSNYNISWDYTYNQSTYSGTTATHQVIAYIQRPTEPNKVYGNVTKNWNYADVFP